MIQLRDILTHYETWHDKSATLHKRRRLTNDDYHHMFIEVLRKEFFMPYDERIVAPMREELTLAGLAELRTVEDVDRLMKDQKGTLLVVVNSVCGCAAGMARPGVVSALKHSVVPDLRVTVFAGQDVEATARMREYIGADIPPSSPSMALFRNGELIWMLPRHQIEGRTADMVSKSLKDAFDRFCIAQPA
jgi:putative YphP/YqiW family bacilliredoxin